MNYTKIGQVLQYKSNKQQNKAYSVSSSLCGSDTDICSSIENLSLEDRFVICNTSRQEPQGQENNRYSTDSSYNTLIIHGTNDERRLSSEVSPYLYNIKHMSVPPKLGSKEVTYRKYDPGVCEITNIPDDYLSQSQVLKHLAKEVKVPYNSENRNYGKSVNCSSLSPNNEWINNTNTSNQSLRSKSQPDLTRLHKTRIENLTSYTLGNTKKDQKCIQNMETLIQENKNLRLHIEACYLKVAKARKLEYEVIKVYRAHEDLVKTCERREKLERLARLKLQTEIARLQETNRSLREQLDFITKQLLTTDDSHNGIEASEISKRDTLIAQLISQNKELMLTKERQDIELSAQRATLEEQRTHINILDKALMNAQETVVQLEDEVPSCDTKPIDRVAQLQRALSSLQMASDRREQIERKLRVQLENELKMERTCSDKTLQIPNPAAYCSENLPELRRKIREKDERIMQLESDVEKWKQRYLEESNLRQAAIDAASIPKDAKIAVLEKTSQENEKIIAEARSDKLRQMDEIHAAQKKILDLESRIKELESRLAERDAMIRVLQKKHTLENEVTTNSYPSISLSHLTPHSSLNIVDLNTQDIGGPTSTTSVLSTASSVLTSSTGFGSNTSYGGSISSSIRQRGSNKYSSSNQSFDEKSLDDQLKELDSQLLSKASLIQALCREKEKHPNHYWRV